MEAVQGQKTNRTWIIVAVVVGVLLCCCCLLAGGALAYTAFTTSTAVSEFQEEVPFFEETEPGEEIPFEFPGMDEAVPQGGLGDDLLRANTWTYVMLVIAIDGCEVTSAADTQIEVLSEPDSNGNWSERWEVQCADGSSTPVIVDFSPAAGGGTDLNVRLEE